MTSLKTSIKTITYLSDIGCLEIQGASLVSYKDEWGDKYKSEVDVKSHDIMLGVTYNF